MSVLTRISLRFFGHLYAVVDGSSKTQWRQEEEDGMACLPFSICLSEGRKGTSGTHDFF